MDEVGKRDGGWTRVGEGWRGGGWEVEGEGRERSSPCGGRRPVNVPC